MATPEADHYAVLGVAPDASPAEIRRAYRRLALSYHPDRAGDDATPIFQRIARAYAVLADASTRAAYDRTRTTRVGGGGGGFGDAGNGFGDQARRAPGDPSARSGAAGARAHLLATLRSEGKLLERLSQTLDDLVARGIAGAVAGAGEPLRFELRLDPGEARRGGVALIDMRLDVACSTCGGIARPGGFWCRRCDSTGRAREVVTVYCAIPARVADGATMQIPTATAGGLEPVTIRVRVPPPTPSGVPDPR